MARAGGAGRRHDVVACPDALPSLKYRTASDAQALLRSALGLVDAIVSSSELIEEAFVTAVRHGHPVYDALYLVTARRSGATVCTRDRRLAALLEETRVPVELI